MTICNSAAFCKYFPDGTDTFFILSAYSFKTEAVDQRDGYTLLYLPNLGLAQENSHADEEVKKVKTACHSGARYVMWEIVND